MKIYRSIALAIISLTTLAGCAPPWAIYVGAWSTTPAASCTMPRVQCVPASMMIDDSFRISGKLDFTIAGQTCVSVRFTANGGYGSAGLSFFDGTTCVGATVTRGLCWSQMTEDQLCGELRSLMGDDGLPSGPRYRPTSISFSRSGYTLLRQP